MDETDQHLVGTPSSADEPTFSWYSIPSGRDKPTFSWHFVPCVLLSPADNMYHVGTNLTVATTRESDGDAIPDATQHFAGTTGEFDFAGQPSLVLVAAVMVEGGNNGAQPISASTADD